MAAIVATGFVLMIALSPFFPWASMLLVAGSAAEAIGLWLSVVDLREQQRRLALVGAEGIEPFIKQSRDNLQHLVGQKRKVRIRRLDLSTNPFRAIENLIEREGEQRRAGDLDVVKYLDERMNALGRELDRRRRRADAVIKKELVASLTDPDIYRGPRWFALGLILSTASGLIS